MAQNLRALNLARFTELSNICIYHRKLLIYLKETNIEIKKEGTDE
jgi:hypothetical protein